MKLFANMSPGARRSALAAMMLALLLVGTAVAWLISASRSAAREGEQWYLITEGDRPVGWQVVQHESLDAGGATGYEVQAYQDGVATVAASTWTLNAQATRGDYVSLSQEIQQNRLGRETTTYIDYKDPQVFISQVIGNRQYTVDALDVGSDYIAEGRLRPKIVEVAGTQKDFTGKMVIDSKLALVPLQLMYEGVETRTVHGKSIELAAVAQQWLGGSMATSYLRHLVDLTDGSIPIVERVDAAGTVLQSITLVGLDAVRLHYSEAHRMRSRILAVLREQ